MPFSHTKVAIVLLSYNSLKLIKQFLPKILETTPNTDDIQVYVVDNASTDNTGEFVSANFPNVNLITIKTNHGFTGGYTESLAQIPADYYVLISSDIEVTPNWLEAPIKLLDNDKEVAAVQPKVRSYQMREKLEYAGAAGGFIDFLGYPFCRGRLVNELEVDKGQYDTETETFWASGACLFIRADLYHQAGGLDNDFFAHMEEIDLCWRLRNMGYKIMYTPQSLIYHMGGYIISYGSPQKVFRNHRNNLIMLLKNLPFQQALWKIPVRFAMDALTFYKMVFDGERKPAMGIIQAHWEFVSQFSKWWKKRQFVQKKFTRFYSYGIYQKSLVWEFFVRKKKKFSDLNWNL